MHNSHENHIANSTLLHADLATQSEFGDSGTEDGALRLLSGTTWGGDGSGINLRYNFFSSVPGYYSSTDTEANRFREFNDQMKASTLRVLDEIETFTNINFIESSNTAYQLGFGQARLPDGTGAWAYYPTRNPKGGDVWTNNLYANTQNPVEGNYGHFLLLHEVGHALGLRHSFDRLSGQEASSQYSVMAYDWSPYFPASYMLYDIYALQNLYGANMSHATGDDVYVLDNNLAYTIWDAGGNDTFDASAYNFDVVLNLNDGSYSSVGLDDNIAIAFNAVIENAWGGSRNDKITGNGVSNILQGNAGDDILVGSAGNDTLNGGAGDDTVVYNLNIEDFLINIIDSVTVELFDASGLYNTDTLISIETYEFNLVNYSYDDLLAYNTGTFSDGAPLRPAGAVFSLSPVVVNTIDNDVDINLSTVTDRTIGIAFETGADVGARQVIFEQGGAAKGFNIYIEDGQLHQAAWDTVGTRFGYREATVDIEANTRYTTTMLFEGGSRRDGTITLYLDSAEVSSVGGVGYVKAHGGDIGIGEMVNQTRFVDGAASGNGYAFQGTLEQITYYNNALSASDITRLDDNLSHEWLAPVANRAPEPQDDDVNVLLNTDTLLDVLSNDSDPDGDILDVISAVGVSHGTLTLNADDTILYSPDIGYEGTDSFTYTVRDKEGLENTATVNIDVIADVGPDAPPGSIFSLNPVTVNTIANDTDINLSTVTDRTIGLSFETGADVGARQVLYEQGGAAKGFNIYIEDGQLHHAAWDTVNTRFGYKEAVTDIEANTQYTTAMLFEGGPRRDGTITLFLDGTEMSSVDRVGYVKSHGGDIGIGQMVNEARFASGTGSGDGYAFQGTISKIAYYNDALEGAELTQLNDYLDYNLSAPSHDLHGLPAYEEIIDTDTLLEESLSSLNDSEESISVAKIQTPITLDSASLSNDELPHSADIL